MVKPVVRKQTDEDFYAMTLRSVLKTYEKSPTCPNVSLGNLPTIYRFIGDTKVDQITKSWFRNYIAKVRGSSTRIRTKFSWSTIHKHIQIMSAAVRWQAEELNLTVSRLPFDIKRMFPKDWENKRNRRLEPYEYVALMARVRKIDSPSSRFWRYLIRLAIETAARQQELLKAEWREVDLVRRLWVIPASHTKTKTERTVPLSMRAVRILKMLEILKSKDSQNIFHCFKSGAVVSALFHRFTLDAKVRDFKFHDLRHEGISRMVLYKRKLSVYEIMEIVGHSSIEMLRRYANIRKDELVGRMD
jgi:integrase